jgi:hypothetical protein
MVAVALALVVTGQAQTDTVALRIDVSAEAYEAMKVRTNAVATPAGVDEQGRAVAAVTVKQVVESWAAKMLTTEVRAELEALQLQDVKAFDAADCAAINASRAARGRQPLARCGGL